MMVTSRCFSEVGSVSCYSCNVAHDDGLSGGNEAVSRIPMDIDRQLTSLAGSFPSWLSVLNDVGTGLSELFY
jgi:hypothetical protein